jgi:hypothetical protein
MERDAAFGTMWKGNGGKVEAAAILTGPKKNQNKHKIELIIDN